MEKLPVRPIFGQLAPVAFSNPGQAPGATFGVVLSTAGLSLVDGTSGRVAFAQLSPDQLLLLGTLMARAARTLGASPEAADDALSELERGARADA
jgi:hypothetical protein